MRTITVAGVTFSAKDVVAVTLRRGGKVIEIVDEDDSELGFHTSIVDADEAELIEDEYEGEEYDVREPEEDED